MTAPYYEDDFVTLYHGDCLELADLWTCADVLVTDPPYGMSYVSGQRTQQAKVSIAGDDTLAARDRMVALWGERPAAIFGTWKQPRPTGVRQVLIWDKTDGTGPGMGDLGAAFGTSHEDIYLLGEWPRGVLRRRGSVIRTSMAIGSTGGLAATIGHPTPKPISLMEAVMSSAPPGAIADPFAGSGSTLVAAKTLGRRAIGVELEEKYCEIAAKRLMQDAFNFEETA